MSLLLTSTHPSSSFRRLDLKQNAYRASGRPRTRSLILGIVALHLANLANLVAAGEYNPVLDIGDAAPAWKELIGVDDQRHSLEDLQKSAVVVVVFTCNSCPYAVDYEDRLIALHNAYQKRGVSVVAINVNRVPEDQLPAMKERAKEKMFPFPYLYDETQQIARVYGAGYTPEFFVLNQDRKIAYMGAMDDSPDGSSIKTRYVERAIKATLDQTAVTIKETVPIGCRVRFQRQRRRRD